MRGWSDEEYEKLLGWMEENQELLRGAAVWMAKVKEVVFAERCEEDQVQIPQYEKFVEGCKEVAGRSSFGRFYHLRQR
jgi:hypothetical protein